MIRRLAIGAAAAVAVATLSAGSAPAEPGPGPGTCQFLGANYNVWYPCDQDQPWLQYGTGDNPPYGSPLPASECTGINAHNVGCS